MPDEGHVPMEKLEVFRRYVALADWVWNCVHGWPPIARDTVGKQWVRAMDSVGANLVEGDGRYHNADALHFFIIARASAREARYWQERAMERNLVSQELGAGKMDELKGATQLLNRLINYRRTRSQQDHVKEADALYEIDDPFLDT